VILAGAIGGTKTVLALCEASEDGGVRMIRTQKFLAEETPSLDKALEMFLRQRDIEALYGACFGVAGPVAEGVAKITNLGWTIDARSLSSRFGITVSLLNDLQAIALGSQVVPPEKFCVLQGAASSARLGEPPVVPARRTSRIMQAVTLHDAVVAPPVAVMALGTGLGEATLVHDGMRYRALPSEGGHADFAPTTDDEIELLRFLRARHGSHVSYERVLSGSGIGEIYAFARSRSGEKEPTWLAHEMAAGDPNGAIVSAALGDRKDPCCVQAIEMFAEILGAEAGNIALRSVAGSVVIGGGIPHKVLAALQSGGLIRRFNDKGRFSGWTSTVGVRVLLEPRAGLLGAALYAATVK
jgi:glucokinase